MKKELITHRVDELNALANQLRVSAGILLNDIIVELPAEKRAKVKGFWLSDDVQIIGINPDCSIDVEITNDNWDTGGNSIECSENAQTKIDSETLEYEEIMALIGFILVSMK